MHQSTSASILNTRILIPAIGDAIRKLHPKPMARNRVMFVVAVVAVLTTILCLSDQVIGAENIGLSLQLILWLCCTLLFANAVAEWRGKAQAVRLRKARSETRAKPLNRDLKDGVVVAGNLRKVGDVVLVEKGDIIRSDGGVVGGMALIIVALVPPFLRGVTYRVVGAGAILRRNPMIYGLGGILLPLAAIRRNDVAISAARLV